VERGGYGAGTIIRFEFRIMGTSRQIRAEVTEPRPGEELVETDVLTGARTTFRVLPLADGRRSEVTITTEWEPKGLRGWIERFTAPPLFRRIYTEELAQLAALATAYSNG
jgi:Polyketide cyclase / dehydrase and lipid transport